MRRVHLSRVAGNVALDKFEGVLDDQSGEYRTTVHALAGIPAVAPSKVRLRVEDAFRRRLFLHEDGFVLSFFAAALTQRGVLARFESGESVSVGTLAQEHVLNPAYLHVVLRGLAQAGWLVREGQAGTADLTYSMNPDATRGVIPTYVAIGQFLLTHLPFEGTVLAIDDASDSNVDSSALERLVAQAESGWNVESDLVRQSLDGGLVTPLMTALWRQDRLGDRFWQSGHASLPLIERFLTKVGWIDPVRRLWTLDGQEAQRQVLHYGMVGSYIPMLCSLPRLLDGAPANGVAHATHAANDQGEQHVDRRLNVLASGHAHKRYFTDADEIFIQVFDREPLEKQPMFVADNGCGDGSWLQHIYGLVRDHTERGKHLDQYPLLMIGADYNEEACRVARQTLADADVPALVMFGDISNPDQFARDLKKRGIDATEGLHIRSFIDHNRVYDPQRAAAARELGLQFESRCTGAYVDEEGRTIASEDIAADLVGFLKGWSPYAKKHGLVILEAHCVDPEIASKYVGQTHNIVFDSYHGLSRQYPIDFNVFMEAAELAGLRPVAHQQRRYPTRMPFVAISFNRFLVADAVDFEDASETARFESVPPPRESYVRELRPRDESARDESRRQPGTWTPDGTESREDGESLHQLLYRGGDLAHARRWCGPPTGVLVARTLARVDALLRQIENVERMPVLTILDYGAGTGLFSTELLKAMQTSGQLAHMKRLGVHFELALIDLPNAWFAKGYELLHTSPHVRFYSLRAADGSFARLPDVLGGDRVDIAVASMVFHLIPPKALSRVFDDFAEVLSSGGSLLWSSPDIAGPTSGVLFHEANRRCRARVLELLDQPALVDEILERVPAAERSEFADLPLALEHARTTLTADARAHAAARAERQILPSATNLSHLSSGLSTSFAGETFTRTFEMLPSEALDTILVPSNQHALGEVQDEELRRRVTKLVMLHDVLPSLVRGPYGTTDGFSVQWSFGDHVVTRGDDARTTEVQVPRQAGLHSLESILTATAAAHPNTVAIKTPSSALTYAELDRLANQVARGLVQLGVRPGDRVGLWLEKSPEAIVAMQAALRIGAVYVPVDPMSPARRAGEVLRDCNVQTVVTTAARAAALTAEGLTVATITTSDDANDDGLTWRDIAELSAAPMPPAMREEDDLAYILYTSGSTGKPKGVCISHRNALAFIEWSREHVGARAGDRFASHASFHFDLSVFDLYASFLSGGTTCLIPEGVAFSPAALVDFIQQEKISIWYSVPSALILMMEHGGLLDIENLPMHTVIFAGEPFPIKHLRRLRERWPNLRLYNYYGPTETNVCTAHEVGEIDPDRVHPVPIGKASCGDRVWAVKEDGSAAGPGEEGELLVSGPTVMLGYWGAKPQRGPYRTGDIVRVLDDGNYEYVGRRDNMVKIRGFRIELGDIEAALLTHPELASVAVAVAGSGVSAKLVMFAVARSARPSLLQLKRHCADRLPRYMIVDDVRYVDALPRTANGKIDRIELTKRASDIVSARAVKALARAQ